MICMILFNYYRAYKGGTLLPKFPGPDIATWYQALKESLASLPRRALLGPLGDVRKPQDLLAQGGPGLFLE